MAPKNEPETTKASGTASDEPRSAAKTYSGARGNRPGDLPVSARFRKASKEDMTRTPNSYPELDDERERALKRKTEREAQEKEELEAAVRKANAK